MKVKLSLDKTRYFNKPNSKETAFMKKRLPQEENYYDIKTIADCVGEHGQAFLPATYKGLASKQENFEQCQLFGIDFDDEPDYEKIKRKLADYHLPIVFSYDTFSSTPEHPKYRIILCHIVPITERWLADMILKMLKKMFPEADKHCFETARLFYGGKGLREFHDVVDETGENTFNVCNLVREYERFLYVSDKKNFSRNLKSFAHKYKLNINNTHLDIQEYNTQSRCSSSYIKNEEKTRSNIKYELYIPETSSKIIFYESQEEVKNTHSSHCIHKKIDISMLEKVSSNKICMCCKLWKDFFTGSGEPLSHNEKYLLATNILFLSGYQKIFLETLKEYYPDSNIDKWKYDISYMKKENYNPTGCHVCKYANNCNHAKNLLETLRGRKQITYSNKQNYISIDECVEQVSSELNAAIKKKAANIHLIPGQTGIGKTTLYVNLIKSRKHKKTLLIAVPTNNLKTELVQKIGKDNILEIPSFDDLPLPPKLHQTIEEYYNKGFIKEALDSIETYAHKLTDNSIFMNYLHPETVLAHPSKCVIMTHARFLSLPHQILKNFEVLIDEDILYTMLTRTGSIQISSLKKALEENIFPIEKRMEIEDLLELKDKKYRHNKNRYSFELDTGIIKNSQVTDNLTDFVKADCYMKQKDSIKYLAPIRLPKCKLIILSATLDEDIYNLFFPERKIIYHEIEQAAYKGHLIQYPWYSMSRKAIKDLTEKDTLHCPTVSTLFKKIMANTNNAYYGITFKKYENDIPLERTLHFGNLTGTDYYSGKNGVIIGTPHFPSYLYQLIAFSIGISDNSTLKNRKVNYKGYNFLMMAYKNKELQRIQFYLISSELEQAVGRSRLLRTDSTVYLFSNFPCSQAAFCLDNYLKNADAQELDTDENYD